MNERVKVAARLVHLSSDYILEDTAEIVINSTSIGLGNAEARVPLQSDSLRSDVIVADVVFNPPQTKLIRDAAARGCTTLDGLGMLVNQGVIGFKIWTGVDPDAEVMRGAGGVPGDLARTRVLGSGSREVHPPFQ